MAVPPSGYMIPMLPNPIALTVAMPSTSRTVSATVTGMGVTGAMRSVALPLTTKSALNPRLISDLTDRVAEAANTVMNTTSVTPITTADAVAEVRRGLRAAFSVARRPVTPRKRGSGSPRMRMVRPARTGPTTRKPTIRSPAPPPTRGRASVSPACRHAADRPQAPMARPTAPAMIRPRDRSERSTAMSRRAASGGTRVARIAGRSDARRVTATPISRDSAIAVGRTTSVALGSGAPDAPSAASTPRARSTPAPTPSTAATSPTTTASSSTEPSTWARLAPRARSSASSLVRWATRIEKVFEMTKIPTSSAMAPNTTSAISRNPRLVWLSSDSWRAASSPVTTSARPPSSTVISSTSCSDDTPSSARANTLVSSPSSPASRWASGSVNAAVTAPPALFAAPSAKLPTRV